MPDYTHALIIIIVMGTVTVATRILPVLIFGRNEKVPDIILYLGSVLPYPEIGLLIVSCLKDVSVTEGSRGLPAPLALVLGAVPCP